MNVASHQPNHILGVTASQQEYQAYMRLIIEEPRIALYYKALFGDIYTLAPRLLPDFDLVTLFHLCEFYDSTASAYAPLNDASLLEMFLSKLKPEGQVLFYKGSMSFNKARVIIENFVQRGKLRLRQEHQSLLVYDKP